MYQLRDLKVSDGIKCDFYWANVWISKLSSGIGWDVEFILFDWICFGFLGWSLGVQT